MMNPSALKRIKKEIAIIQEKLPSYEVYLMEMQEYDKNTYIEVITPNYNRLVFNIPNDFPFKPPMGLTLNGENYRQKLKFMPKRIQYLYDNPNDVYYQERSIIKHYKKPECLCCSTLLCPDNWSPVCTLYRLLVEINDHNILKRQISYKLCLKPIFDKYGLPVEILRYLFVFL